MDDPAVREKKSLSSSDPQVGRGPWLAPLLLAATPFVLFALLMLLDRLTR